MGRLLLVSRLAARDLRRRPTEAALLLLAVLAATTTLTLGLVLHGVTSQPYASTRHATAGPDVVAQVDPPAIDPGHRTRRQPPREIRNAQLAALDALLRSHGVVGHSGPFPLVTATVRAGGHRATVQVEGRHRSEARVDQPKLTAGTWVRRGGVVVERGFAEAFHVKVGEPIALNGHPFAVVGIAVTAAMAPYPSQTWFVGGVATNPGLAWLTESDARTLARSAASTSYVLNLRLSDPNDAPAFVAVHGSTAPPSDSGPQPPVLQSWQALETANGSLVENERRALLTSGWLLGVLALASIAVLVGGRMSDQTRRVGLLKAVGATPLLVASVLLAQYLLLALLAAIGGLVVGRLLAPLLTDPSAGLVGSAGPVPFTGATVGIVLGAALLVAITATLIPALRSSRTSTVMALADTARPPPRTAWLIGLSAHLPVPLLLGLRVAGRRPRRAVLSAVSVTVTVAGIVAALDAHANLGTQQDSSSTGLTDPRTARLSHVLLLITIMLVAQAAVNAIFVTSSIIADSRRSSALSRALGATPRQVSVGLAAAQVAPATLGALLGVPVGLALSAAVTPGSTSAPPVSWLIATVLLTVVVMAVLTIIPTRLGGRRSVIGVLQSETA